MQYPSCSRKEHAASWCSLVSHFFIFYFWGGGEGIGGGPFGTQELDSMTPFGSLATQIFYDFMISSSVISFNTILFYLALYYDVEGKERKTPAQAVLLLRCHC